MCIIDAILLFCIQDRITFLFLLDMLPRPFSSFYGPRAGWQGKCQKWYMICPFYILFAGLVYILLIVKTTFGL